MIAIAHRQTDHVEVVRRDVMIDEIDADNEARVGPEVPGVPEAVGAHK